MAKLVLELAMDNAAFEHMPELEVARILSQLAERIEVVGITAAPFVLRDRNGNLVGCADFYRE